MSKDKVVKEAIKMCERAHAPFSNYKVGSAVEVKSGEIVGGCNIESSSYGLTCCAERVALFRAIAEGIVNLNQLPLQLKMQECLVEHADKSYGSFVVKYQYIYVT